ncbi:MAG TPA: flagellar hook-associated protein FlgK [Spirochaetia bacterium]|nr:flagellar hook-associated protein FlgK [Spirochaetia bacterium]
MQSTFSGIELGKRSLIAHNQSITTTGHNISNASVEGYSRQRVILDAFDPIYMPDLTRENTPGQLGQGVIASRVERIQDGILEGRIVSQANGRGYWAAKDSYLLSLEQVYNEPGDLSVRSLLDRFWGAWQELSIHPEELAARQAVIERGEALIDGIHSRYSSLKQLRDMVEVDITANVNRVNEILGKVSVLNEQIVKVKAMGDNPNDLLDKRDNFVRELSGIIDITVDTRDPDEYIINTGGMHLLQGRVVTGLSLAPDAENEGYSRVLWAKSGEEVGFKGGSLAALLELRDSDIKGEIQNLDLMTVNFIDLVNEVHRRGFGLSGKTGLDFFTEYPLINNLAGNYDRNGDGQYDSSYIFRLNGSNTLDPTEQVGLSGTITLSGRDGAVSIDYFPTDTVSDVVKRINLSGAEVVARLDLEGKLSLKATTAHAKGNPDFVIRHVEDSGQFLVGYAGILRNSAAGGAFDWQRPDAVESIRGEGASFAVAPVAHPSGWIEVNKSVKNDPGSIASGFGENGRPANPGDGSAALAIASLRNSEVMLGGIRTFDDYFAKTVADVGLKGERAARALETENAIMKELEDMKQSISGVNIDEEFSELIKFQHGYTAASRFITELNKMYDTIINRLGV